MDDLVNTMNASKADMVGVKAFSATSTNLDVEFKTHTVTQSTTGASTTTTITVASTANILAGYRVTGHANIQKNTVVASVTNGTTLALSKAPTASIPNSTSLTFAQEDYTLLPFTLTRRAQKSKQTVDLNFPANDAAGLNPFRGVVFKRRNLTGAPQTTLPQMPYDATMDKLLKRINGPATLTFAAARNFSGANALTAGMSVTQAGGVTGTIAANYSSATTASIVVTVTNGTFVSTKETIIDGATSGVKLVPDADLSTVTHADVPFLVTNSGADLVLEWDVAGAESEITGMIEGSISGMVDSVSVHHQGVLDHTNKRSPNTSLACVNHTVTNNAAANLKLRTKGTQNRVTAVELIESPEAGAEATVSGTTMAVNNGVAHNLAANDWVTVENAINGTNNGTFQVAATGLTATAFTLTIGGSAVAETTRIRWAATRNLSAAHQFTAGVTGTTLADGSLDITPVVNHNRVAELAISSVNLGVQAKKNQSLTGLTSANGSGLAITCKGRMGRVKSLTRNGSGDLTIAGANIEMNRNKHKNGVRPEGGSGTGCVVNTTGTMGRVGALQVTVAGTQNNLDKNKSIAFNIDGKGCKATTTGTMGKVVSISVTAGGTASDTPIGANDHKNMFNSAHTAYTNYSGGASYGGKNVAGLTVKTRGTMGVVQSFKRTSGALNITGTNNAVNMNKGQFGGNRPNVRPEEAPAPDWSSQRQAPWVCRWRLRSRKRVGRQICPLAKLVTTPSTAQRRPPIW